MEPAGGRFHLQTNAATKTLSLKLAPGLPATGPSSGLASFSAQICLRGRQRPIWYDGRYRVRVLMINASNSYVVVCCLVDNLYLLHATPLKFERIERIESVLLRRPERLIVLRPATHSFAPDSAVI